MYFKSVLAHLDSKLFSVGQPWGLTFLDTSNLLKSHVLSGSAPESVSNHFGTSCINELTLFRMGSEGKKPLPLPVFPL